ncbi:MAG TPA: pyridoxamine 5'-phosphate oxidase family protein [Methanotrichaceae archaeon]|nr:pyridoxamine 5'-phosphate oxidase family protein [Methanotrichaceae archaeon]
MRKIAEILQETAMDIIKMPRMDRSEYDRLIKEEHICRIAFKGENHSHLAPFLYVFDGRHMYFLSTRYGKSTSRRTPASQ